jgi:5-methylcytosine-specific restriction protein B
MFTWPPLYTELAKALQRFKDRQPELISILNEIRKTGIPIIRLIDAPKPATAPTLATIDPFTFFASFNRGLTEQNRIGILKILKEKFHLNSEIPIDFAGIPVVDNQQSWFFPYRPKRKPDDVESLWKLAEVAIEKKPEELNPQLFDRCLQIYTVGPAKLTMGIFWMNPKNYLALDDKNRAYFQKAGITTEVTDHASYLILLRQVREKFGEDYIQISHKAWEGEARNMQYWAGGFRWGDKSKLDEFTKGNF